MARKLFAALIVAILFASSSTAATLSIRYKDGSTQKVQLRGAPSQISQINIGDDGQAASRGGAINVVAGSYGLNCGTPHGNKTEHLARQCNGKNRCDYTVNYQVIGDPAVGCGKEYVAEWHCGDGEVKSVKAGAEAGYGAVMKLSCP